MATEQELINRWDSFLGKITARFHESLSHAQEACVEQLIETDYEYETVFIAWQGMKAQIRELIAKIDSTWSEKVEPEMRAIGDFWTDHHHKGSELSDKLEEALGAFERMLEGKLSQQFYDHTIRLAEKKHKCTQCDAGIVLKKDIFRAQYITCTYCNTVNTIEPEAAFMKIGWGVVDNIAKVKAQTEYDRLLQTEEALRSQRKPIAESYWQAYESAYFNYWERFFEERNLLNSESIKRLEADRERKRTEFEKYKKIQTS